MERRSLIVAIVGVVLSAGVALGSVAFWLGNLQGTVDDLVRDSTTGAIAEARTAIGDASNEAVARLEDVVAPLAILPVYSVPTSLPPGWVICGRDGTPQLGNRFLLGTTDVAELGASVGSPTHGHQLPDRTRGETGGRFAPERDGNPDYTDNVPDGRGVTGNRNWFHRHLLGGATDPAESLPPSVKVMFLCRVGA